MPKLYFVRRTPSELQIFGGTVYIDIDGKRVGQLSQSDLIIEVAPGVNEIKMYKTHTYDTFVGVAEVRVNFEEDKDLVLRYSAPMVVSQPGHIVITDFISLQEIEEMVSQKETSLKAEKQTNDTQLRQQEARSKKNSSAFILLFILIPVIIGLLYYFIFKSYLDLIF